MSAIDTSTSNQASTLFGANDAYSSMTSEDFIQVMFTELTNQDPLSPNESKDLLDQISTIRQIESDLETTDRLGDMVRQNELTAASSLIGKFVLGQNESLADVGGYVDSVSVTREGISLNLSGGFKVPLDRIEEVIDPSLVGSTPSNTPPTVNNKPDSQTATIGEEFRYSFLADTFSDDEGVELLIYSATLANAEPLPEWLTFNPITREFRGTPPEGTTGPIEIRLTATDSYDARTSTSFTITLSDSPSSEDSE